MRALSETQHAASGMSNAVRPYLTSRRGVFLPAVLLVAVGLYLGWSWLVAAGIAPVLIALAPCAAMCALGLCTNKMAGKSCSTKPETKGDADAKQA